MIAALRGQIIGIQDNQLVVDVSGVGYLVLVPTKLAEKTRLDQLVNMWIHTAVSENDIRLFGFQNRGELKLFKKLLSVKGVGPKVALAIFELPIAVIERAIMGSDYKTLSSVPGLGKKTAEQICLDLRDKFDFTGAELGDDDSPTGLAGDAVLMEAVEALCSLGCDRVQVTKVLVKAPDDLSTEEMVKWYLQVASN